MAVVLDVCDGASKCNIVSFIGFTTIKLVDAAFLTKTDVDFVTNENCAFVSMPTNNIQSHVTIIR